MTTPLDLNAIEQEYGHARNHEEMAELAVYIPQLCEEVRELREKVKGLEKGSANE